MSWFTNLFGNKAENVANEIIDAAIARSPVAKLAGDNLSTGAFILQQERIAALEQAALLVEGWLVLDDELKKSMAAQIRALGQ